MNHSLHANSVLIRKVVRRKKKFRWEQTSAMLFHVKLYFKQKMEQQHKNVFFKKVFLNLIIFIVEKLFSCSTYLYHNEQKQFYTTVIYDQALIGEEPSCP